MEWKVGFKVSHPFNPDWGIGQVCSVGPQGRSLSVRFAGTGETVTLSTHDAAYQRWVFPMGTLATVASGDYAGHEVALVERLRQEDGFDLYRTEEGLLVHETELLAPERTAGPLERLARLEIDPIDHYDSRFAGLSLDYLRQTHGLSGLLGSRVSLFPHQLHVAHQVAHRYPVRALLADEVGLGKTIEAGLVYSALRQASRAERVLVIAPDALTVQWLGELFRKFHDVFVLMDNERLEDAMQDHPDLNPWQIYPRCVVSLQFLIANEALAMEASELEGGWDLVIVDEAHHLRYEEGGGNPAYQIVEAISQTTRSMLFLTATPMELDRREYFGLLRLLRPSLFHDYDLFEIQLEEIARASEIAVILEQALDTFVRQRQEAPASKPPLIELPEDLPDRVADALTEEPELELLAEQAADGSAEAASELLHALSRLHPLGDTVHSNTRARVGGFPKRTGRMQFYPLSEARAALYHDVHAWVVKLASRGLELLSQETAALYDLVRLAAGPLAGLKEELTRHRKRAKQKTTQAFLEGLIARCDALLGEDSCRLDALLDEIRAAMGASEKVLVFVHHIADLELLRDRIEARVGVRAAVFHERLPAADRDIQVAMFRAPDGYPVLLSTEAGGEGRNFQFCHRLIHYDLPVSPNRIEQRIGRLDRIGQAKDVESLVMVSEQTIEHRLALLLSSQVGVFEETIGGLDPVMEEVAKRVMSLSLSPDAHSDGAWKALGRAVEALLHGARDAIARGLDHLLHRGAFDRSAAEALQAAIPDEIEEMMEEFIIDFSEQTGITVQDRDVPGTYYLALDRYCIFDALPGVPLGSAYFGSFSRKVALDREDIDFFASGHPLVEGIFAFLRETPYGTSSLRWFKRTGLRPSIGVQFNYRLEGDPTDIDASVFFPHRLESLAVDITGEVRSDLLPLLTARHSKAYPLDAEDIREITVDPGWLDKAIAVAERESARRWNGAVQEAIERFDAFAEEAEKRYAGYFEHRLDSSEAMIAFGQNSSLVAAARREVATLKKEWHDQLELLKQRRQRLSRGRPVLDSVSFYMVER